MVDRKNAFYSKYKMKYMGSKSRIAKDIVPIIQGFISANNIDTYIEPFVGGANVIDKIKCNKRIGTDKNKYLIALLKRVAEGQPLLENVPRELYNEVRENFKSGIYEDWYVGNVGFLASYNGRWFDGGYAPAGYEKTKNGERYRDYYQESKRNILSQEEHIKQVEFGVLDYRNHHHSGCLIYCDPPYKGTKQYANSLTFDHEEFWNVIREWSKNNIVIVSELNAPSDFVCIWQKSVSRTMKSNDNTMRAVEKLFMIAR